MSPNIVKPTHLRCFLHDKKNTTDQEARKLMLSTWCSTILPGTIFVDEGSSNSHNVSGHFGKDQQKE